MDKVKLLAIGHHADAHGDIIPPKAVIEMPKSVPLYLDGDMVNPIGNVDLKREADGVYGIITLEGVKEKDVLKLTPCISGRSLKVTGAGQKTRRVEDLTIDAVCLSSSNADPNIKSLGEQLYLADDQCPNMVQIANGREVRCGTIHYGEKSVICDSCTAEAQQLTMKKGQMAAPMPGLLHYRCEACDALWAIEVTDCMQTTMDSCPNEQCVDYRGDKMMPIKRTPRPVRQNNQRT